MVHCSTVLSTIAAIAAVSCANGDVRECFEHSECASGFCREDGSCAPVGPDGGSDAQVRDGGKGDGGNEFCQPDHDGVITREEVSFAAGNTATFRIATDTPVDTAGELQPEGHRIWSLAGAMSNDADVEVVLLSMTDTWCADEFPGATYATRLSQSATLLGVFQITESALLLRGVVSPEAGIGRTELVYDPAVTMLDFPISSTSSWVTESTVSGLASGVASYYDERYESQVNAIGELDTPYGTFPVQRVRVELTRTVGAVPVTIRTYMFLSECFGPVATIVSEEYESEVEFTHAAEVRRLAP